MSNAVLVNFAVQSKPVSIKPTIAQFEGVELSSLWLNDIFWLNHSYYKIVDKTVESFVCDSYTKIGDELVLSRQNVYFTRDQTVVVLKILSKVKPPSTV